MTAAELATPERTTTIPPPPCDAIERSRLFDRLTGQQRGPSVEEYCAEPATHQVLFEGCDGHNTHVRHLCRAHLEDGVRNGRCPNGHVVRAIAVYPLAGAR